MSIRDIAKRAGVSPATVSRVLNDPRHRCSSEGLRDRIWQIAREMNYLPNEAARSLKMGSDASAGRQPARIDVIVTRSSQRQPDPFFSELLRVIETETHAQRLLIVHVWYLSTLSGHRSMGGRRHGARACERAWLVRGARTGAHRDWQVPGFHPRAPPRCLCGKRRGRGP